MIHSNNFFFNFSVTHSCGHQDGAASRSELVQSFLSVSLGAVSMDTGAGVSLAVKEVFQSVSSLLGLHEHQSQWVFTCRRKQHMLSQNEGGRKEDKEHGGRETKNKKEEKKFTDNWGRGYRWMSEEDGTYNCCIEKVASLWRKKRKQTTENETLNGDRGCRKKKIHMFCRPWLCGGKTQKQELNFYI